MSTLPPAHPRRGEVFDLNVDPKPNNAFSGSANMAECKACGLKPLSLPQVYHDPDKELLLTFFPELGLLLNEQES